MKPGERTMFPTIEWPKEGDKLFTLDRNLPGYSLHIGANSFGPDPWFAYALAYGEAAKILVRYLTSSGSLNFVVLPTVFLFRHYLELSLKCLILLCQELSGSENQRPKGHRLEDLWPILNRLATDLHLPFKGEDARGAEKCIREIAAIDALSDAFRYPVHKDGKCTHQDADFKIEELARVMEAMVNFLNGAHDFFEAQLESEREMECEQQQEAMAWRETESGD